MKQIAVKISLRKPGIAAVSRVEFPLSKLRQLRAPVRPGSDAVQVRGWHWGARRRLEDVRTRGAWVRWNSSSKVSENWHVGNFQAYRMSRSVIHDATSEADRKVQSYRKQNRRHGLNLGPIRSPARRRWQTETAGRISQTATKGPSTVFTAETRIAYATDGGNHIGASTAGLVEPLTWPRLPCTSRFNQSYGVCSMHFISRTVQSKLCPRNSQFAIRNPLP